MAMKPTAICPACENAMNQSLTLEEAPQHKPAAADGGGSGGSGGGYVKGVVTCMVTD